MEIPAHERALQMLSAILIQVNALQTLVGDNTTGPVQVDGPALHDGLQSIAQMTRETLYLVRTTDDELLPAELAGVTLAEALSRLVEETAETLHVSSRVSFSGVDEQGRPKEHVLSSIAERTLFLIARETLYDMRHHSEIRTIRLTLSYGQNEVQMSIEDDGLATSNTITDETSDRAAPLFMTMIGTTDTASELSIFGDMRYRIEHLGGSLIREPRQERGTRILARIAYTQHTYTEDPPSPLTVIPGQAAPIPLSPLTEQATSVRVLLVDRQAVIRAGLRRLLESYPGLHVVGEAADGVQAVSETLELGPQVVLMDSQLPNGQSLEALRQIKQLQLDTHVLLLSTQDREEYLYETLRAGADGYVLKDIAPDELVKAIRTVARGEVLIQPQLAGRLLSRFGRQGRGNIPYEALTARELEVLRLLARGLRNKEIADRLYISERTVNFHLANIYQKLNVSGRTEALSRALEQGLITA
jgi:DNA-binding NarL/FixJ family response regulator